MESRSEFRWPDPVNGPWTMLLHFQRLGGREECVGFEIWGGTPPARHTSGRDPLPFRPIRAVDVRRPPFAELVDGARRMAVGSARRLLAEEEASEDRPGDGPLEPAVRAFLQERAAAFGGRKAAGRPPTYGPDHFAEVADVYRAAWAETGKPLEAISERWNVSKSAAGKWAARCREMGLLPRTSRGVPRVEEGQ